jgi:NAD+ kinase
VSVQQPLKRVLLFGAHASKLKPELEKHPELEVVTRDPDVVVSYGGDGTLLAAELQYPGLPKVPILNSRRGHRCIPHPASQVLEGLARGELHVNEYTKLNCQVNFQDRPEHFRTLTALNEFATHMGRINSAVRFQMWLNDEPYDNGVEILGDGFIVCTPFGSTAYFNKLTRGIFTKGIGIAFKATTEHTSHLVLPADTRIRILITRGPAQLAYDSAPEILTLEAGDDLHFSKHPQGAIILTYGEVKRLDEPF